MTRTALRAVALAAAIACEGSDPAPPADAQPRAEQEQQNDHPAQTDDAPSIVATTSTISASPDREFVCAIRRSSGEIECWGYNEHGRTDAPEGAFRAVAAERHYACAIRDDRTIACWGDNESGQVDAPAGEFVAVAPGRERTCAIRADGAIKCWGDNEYAFPIR